MAKEHKNLKEASLVELAELINSSKERLRSNALYLFNDKARNGDGLELTNAQGQTAFDILIAQPEPREEVVDAVYALLCSDAKTPEGLDDFLFKHFLERKFYAVAHGIRARDNRGNPLHAPGEDNFLHKLIDRKPLDAGILIHQHLLESPDYAIMTKQTVEDWCVQARQSDGATPIHLLWRLHADNQEVQTPNHHRILLKISERCHQMGMDITACDHSGESIASLILRVDPALDSSPLNQAELCDDFFHLLEAEGIRRTLEKNTQAPGAARKTRAARL